MGSLGGGVGSLGGGVGSLGGGEGFFGGGVGSLGGGVGSLGGGVGVLGGVGCLGGGEGSLTFGGGVGSLGGGVGSLGGGVGVRGGVGCLGDARMSSGAVGVLGGVGFLKSGEGSLLADSTKSVVTTGCGVLPKEEKESNTGSVTPFTLSFMSSFFPIRKSSKPPMELTGFSSGLEAKSSKTFVEAAAGGGGADAMRSAVKESIAGGIPENPMSIPLLLLTPVLSSEERMLSDENKRSDWPEDTWVGSFPKSASILKGSTGATLSVLVSTEAEESPVGAKLEKRSSPEFLTWAIMSSTNPTAAAWVLSATLPMPDETEDAELLIPPIS